MWKYVQKRQRFKENSDQGWWSGCLINHVLALCCTFTLTAYLFLMVLKILEHWPWNHKKVVWNSGVQPGIFQGRIGLLEKRNFDKHLIYNIWKESPTGKHFEVFFFLDTFKTAFWMTKFNTKINTVGTFSSSKSVYFTPLLPTSCVSGIGFLQCHKKNIDITKKHSVSNLFIWSKAWFLFSTL